MKLYAIAKELNISIPVAIKMTERAGYKFGSNSNITDPDLIKETIKRGLLEEQEKCEKLKKLSKAVFIGMIFNPETKRFTRYKLNIGLDELATLNCDLVELGESSTLPGAKLELMKCLQKHILSLKEKEFEV